MAGQLWEAMLLRRVVPLSLLPSQGVRRLLPLMLHCQQPEDRLPVATGILWAIAQVSLKFRS